MKKIFVIFLVVLISVGLYSETKVNKVPLLNDVNPNPIIPIITDDVGDIIFDLDVEAIVADNQLLGVEFDGTYIWITGGGNAVDPNYLYKVDPVAGTLVASYEQPAAASGWGIRDLAYVAGENKIYGGNETNFFSFDIEAETWDTEFASTFGTIRALAYDGNHFWTKSFGDPIYEFDVTGMLHGTYVDANSAYGFAYDSFADCLWLFASTTTFVQFGLDGIPTGTTHAVTLPNGGIIGGAFYYEGGLVPGKTILGCLGQGTPDVVYGMELRDAAPLDAPGAPTGVTVTPDAGGALEAEIGWTCPDVDVSGATLTDLDEMRVYRDDVLIYTDPAPTIGGPGTYPDTAVPASGNYAYKVVGFNDFDEGIPVVISSWVGEDVPNIVESLLLEDVGGDGYLTWINPTTGLNGGAFNNAIWGYHITRHPDNVVIEATGVVTEYTDTTIPSDGTYSYSVQAYNSVGDGGIATSNEVWIGDSPQYCESTYTDAGAGADDYILNVTFGTIDNTTAQEEPLSYGDYTSISTDIDAGTTYPLCVTLGYEGTYYTQHVRVWFDWNQNGTLEGVESFYIGIAPDDGINQICGDILVPVDATPGETRMRIIEQYSSDPGEDGACDGEGNHTAVYGETEDYTVNIVTDPVDPGYIEGTVVIADGAGDVEDVDVEAGGVIVNPASDGTYSIELQPGTYDVTATLAGYDEETITGVMVTEGNTTSGVDFSLMTDGDEIIIAATKLNGNYPNPFNPVTTIGYSIKETGNVTLEVYNLRGQLVKRLVNEVKETGNHTVVWNGTDNSNKSVSSGVYFYKMVSEGNIGRYTSTKKMILMK